MVHLRVEGLSKRYGEFYAVREANFEVNDEEFFVVLGPSGCGKSTMLNMVAGLEAPSEGDVYFDDELVNDRRAEKRDIAMVFQSFALYPTKTVHDNIAFPLKLSKMPKEEIERRVDEACLKLKITHLLKKKPHQLSGGERQRVAVARAIVRKPKLFLLDEPLSNIDAKLRQHMRVELIALQNELKITTIYVTHDQTEAMTMADRLMVMDHGKIAQIGKPLEVFHKPQNLFVAGFIGTPPMNFFPCALKKVGEHYALANAELNVPISDEFGQRIAEKAPRSELILGIRPQDLSAVTSAGSDAQGSFEASVYAVEPLGTETIIDVKVGDEIYKFVGPAIFEPRIGDRLRVQIDATNLHVFETKTGDAIN